MLRGRENGVLVLESLLRALTVVRVHVDGSRQHRQAGRVDDGAGLRLGASLVQAGDLAALDSDGGAQATLRRNHQAILDQSIHAFFPVMGDC
ncbi:hypothetical protein D3C86_1909130 [compost metagenome]